MLQTIYRMIKDVGKTYQLQIRGVDGTYKRVVPPSLIMSQISFSSQINGGQGQFTLKINIKIDNIDYKQGDILRITCYNKASSDGSIIYSGLLTRIKRIIGKDGEYCELYFIGLYSILGRIIFKNGSLFTGTLTDDPKNIIKQAIDYFNTVYTAGLFTTSEIDSYGSTISIDFDYNKCIDIVSIVEKITSDWFFYFGPDGKVYYKDTNGTLINHRLKFGVNVDSLDIEENIEQSVNNIFVDKIYGPYTDAGSVLEYGRIDVNITGTNVSDIATANIFGDNYIQENKDIAKQTTMVVNSRYDIESIKPGDIVQLLNTDYLIPRMLITKVNYTYDKVTLSLNRYDTFASSVLESN